jgi:Flp pilus assembly protein TadG
MASVPVVSAARLGRRLLADSSGNTLAIAATAVVMLLAAIGGGVDMSRAYMTKTNLQAACDAGVLAGRRALSKTAVYEEAEKAAATRMFDFNMHAPQTSATDVVFTSSATDDGSVIGSATAKMPTVIMQMFGTKDFALKAECSAELQMASADVMFVLDVTGSMDTKIDGVKKIDSLRLAVRDFHKTIAGAVIDKEATVIRYAFVPYSQTVNPTGILASGAMKSAWFADQMTVPTRYAVFDIPFSTTTTNPTTTVNTTESLDGLTDNQCTDYGKNIYAGGAGTPIAEGGPAPATETTTSYTRTSYKVTSGKNVKPVVYTCVRTKKVVTKTYTVVNKFAFNNYVYGDATYDTDGLVPGGSFSLVASNMKQPDKVGDAPLYYLPTSGTYDPRALALMIGKPNVKLPSATTTLPSCLSERKTVMDLTMNPVPSGALDLNINDEPDEGNDDTKWKVMLSSIYYTRTSATDGTKAASPACPAPMRQFEKVDTTDPEVPDWMGNYLDGLVATGSTYHDIGMIWGARLASTRGMYKSNVLAGERNSVSRHVIFMTDGQMEPTNNAFSAYNIEGYEHKVAPPNSTDGANSTLATYHNNRFLAACQRAKEEGYTIWLIGFGTTVTNVMKSCSSANRAYQANNTDELKAAFRYIAGQVADLRLNK